jgi:hypothetical protein
MRQRAKLQFGMMGGAKALRGISEPTARNQSNFLPSVFYAAFDAVRFSFFCSS